ncbi:MAG TPA: GNAT family N-acetyltransferase, partial [Planctomycetota bacterium]|nr:GNAT family N-acetyltransferase [Planctomycetota bacterium]
MTELPDFEVRDYRPGDEVAILRTFNRVFAEVDPTFVPRTLAEWLWQYAENPSGHRIKVAATPEGEVISQCAAFGQRVWLEGERALFVHMVDSMTDPRYRRGLKKPGFFVLTTQPWRADSMGPPPNGVAVAWGLPIPPAWRIGKVYLSYKMLCTQQKLVADLDRLRPAAAPGVAVRELDAPPEDGDDLFERA